jgi:hypothetical protein
MVRHFRLGRNPSKSRGPPKQEKDFTLANTASVILYNLDLSPANVRLSKPGEIHSVKSGNGFWTLQNN